MIDFQVSHSGSNNIKNLDSFMRKALRRAQSDAAKSMKSLAARLVSSEYWLSASQVKQYITDIPEGIKVTSKRLTMEKYKLSPTRPNRKRQLMGAVKRSGGLKPLGRNTFLRPVHGTYKPFYRRTKNRLPIDVLTGPAVPQLVQNNKIFSQVSKQGNDTFQKRLAHHLAHLKGG